MIGIRRSLLALLTILLVAGAWAGHPPRAGAAPDAPDGAYQLLYLSSIREAPGHLIGLAYDAARPDLARHVASRDGGRTWQIASLPPDGAGPSLALATRGAGQQPRWVAGYGPSGPNPFYRSGDGGATWAAAAVSGPAPWGLTQGVHIQSSPASSIYLYASQSGYERVPCGEVGYCDVWYSQLLVSQDAGVTWVANQPTTDELRITPSPVLPRRIYRKLGGWGQSDDAGATWVARSFPVLDLVPDGANADWLYSDDDGGKRSTDGGATWRPWATRPCNVPVGLTAHPRIAGLIYARCDDTLRRSRDGGDTWQQLNPGAAGWLHADLGHPSRLLLVSGPRILESLDEGDTWRPLTNSVITFRHFVPAVLGR